jgi:aminopeptidase
VYTAPIKESVNGYITYNLPSIEGETTHNNIYFEFENGKIINATSDHSKELNEVLDTDEGARYIGEFSFGLNPFITKCYNNTLYDEKISGTIHFTPGNAYEKCNNGNKSVIHWDIVQSHLPEFGGGEIWLDSTLIRKDGLFVVEDLKCLNPDELIQSLSQNKDDELRY